MTAVQRQGTLDTQPRKDAGTPRRSTSARREVETSAWLEGFVRRIVRRAGVRVADADEVEFAIFLDILRETEAAAQTAVDGLRARGVSWRIIGEAAGITRQAAQMKWGRTRGEER